MLSLGEAEWGETIGHHHLQRLATARDLLKLKGLDTASTAWNFLLRHSAGAVVDPHVIVLDGDGNGVFGPPEAGAVYPAASLTGPARIGDRVVDCIVAAWAVTFRNSYTGDSEDRADVLALCRRFGLPVPSRYSEGAAGNR